jgi:hypothetical protein
MFAVQIASNAFFYHSHTIDGKTYSHAHPGCDGHSHTAADFAFYQQLQNIVSEETPTLLKDVIPVYLQDIQTEVCISVSEKYSDNNAGRAPPVA